MFSSVVLLNWSGWKDTIECLESVFRLNCPDFTVVVCDNGSEDGSLEKIREWAEGRILADCANPQLSYLSLPPVAKPIPYHELTRRQAESGTASYDTQLVLIQNGANLGFAAGNNVGLRYALGNGDCQYFWILNNDTVVEPEALSAMIHHMQQQPEMALCGSLNLSYYSPKEVQAQGGYRYCRWTGHVYTPPLRTVEELDSHPAPFDYIHGASMLASRAFLERVGLMEESYFLYFEELDWAVRAKDTCKLGYARESVIYHKEGAALGSSQDRTKRSPLSENYLSRNRVLFTRRFFPWALPSVLASVFLSAVRRLCQGDFERAKAMFSFMLQGLKARIPKQRQKENANDLSTHELP
jgi:GT2 family glycosyltransferase